MISWPVRGRALCWAARKWWAGPLGARVMWSSKAMMSWPVRAARYVEQQGNDELARSGRAPLNKSMFRQRNTRNHQQQIFSDNTRVYIRWMKETLQLKSLEHAAMFNRWQQRNSGNTWLSVWIHMERHSNHVHCQRHLHLKTTVPSTDTSSSLHN